MAWRRWITGLVVGAVFLGSTAKADAPMVGKYACIVENTSGMIGQKQKIAIAGVKLNNEKFILTLSDNTEDNQSTACSRAMASISDANPDMAFVILYRIHCASRKKNPNVVRRHYRQYDVGSR